eukprot:m.27653 g.27653  ORF g.27653 m.27653 type:complete len:290 (+) comp11769_c0_seq1:736-1605(+)
MDLNADDAVMNDILQPLDALQRDTDLGALFTASSDAMLGLGNDGLPGVDFVDWADTPMLPQSNEQQWSSWAPETTLFQEEPVVRADRDLMTSPSSSMGMSPSPPSPLPSPSPPTSGRPSLEELEATVMAQSARSRESGLKHLAVSDDDIPDSLDALSDRQLAMVDFKILMHLMTKAGLSKDQIAEVKARRRRLKNRLSARLCSNKKREKCSELEDTNRDLLSTLRDLSAENQTLRSDAHKLQEANSTLTKSSFDAARENAMLRAQVAHLTQMLATAGIVPDEEGAAFAA